MVHSVTNLKRGFWGVALILGLTACQSVKPLQWTGYRGVHLVWQGMMPRSVEATLGIYNPNGYTLEVKQARVQVQVGGLPVGTWSMDSTQRLPGRDTVFVPVRVQFNASLAVGDLLRLLGKDSLGVAATGSALVGRHGVYVKVPVLLNRSWSLR